jgi:hypothetical protein
MKGEKKPGAIRTMTEPAWNIAFNVVIRKTAHPTNAVIHVAGEAMNEAT